MERSTITYGTNRSDHDDDQDADDASWAREWGQATPLPGAVPATQARSECVTKRDRPGGSEPHMTVIVELSLDDIADATE